MTHFAVTNDYGRPAVCFDLDGTLAVATGREELGEPTPLLQLAERLTDRGWLVLINSARPVSHNPTVRRWLLRHSPMLYGTAELVCGSKPAADVFVDDKGLMLPIDALEERIELAAAASSTALWTEGDLTLRPFTAEWFEVHDNPEWHGQETDPKFAVVVPLSGGLDSLTCFAMAQRAGLTVQPVYVNTGAPYSGSEIDCARELLAQLGHPHPLHVIDLHVDYQTLGGYIDLGRNAVICWQLAEVMHHAGLWGEVWFGNVGDWQESPVRGGDKSHRFFGTFNQILAASGRDVRVVSPLVGHTKADLVHWWASRGMLSTAARSFSCYSTGPAHCGRCRACFKRWVTFGAAGFSGALRWPDGVEFEQHAESFWRAVATDSSPSMAKGRWEPVGRFLRSKGFGPKGES